TLLEQQQLAIALADADIAYSQSMEDLDAAVQRRTDAQNAYNTAVQQYGANSAEAKQALDDLKASERDWTNQADATAKAAGAVAAARHTNADAATKESYSNAAILLDLERQKEKYGELPPRLEELRA